MSGIFNHPIGQGLIVLLVVIIHALALLEFSPSPPGPLRSARPMDVALVQAPRPAIPPNPAPPSEPPPPVEATTAPTPKTPRPQPAPPRPVPPQRAGHAPVPASIMPVAKPKPAPTPQPKREPKPTPAPAQPTAPKPAVAAHHESAPPPKRLDLGSLSQQIAEVGTALNLSRTAQADGLRFLHINATNAAQHKATDYLYGWERKLRHIGKLGLGSPKTGDGDWSGSVHLRIALRADGSLYKMEKIRSSGDAGLDAAAEGIVQRAVPLPPFPKDLREECDVLVNDRVFQFENGNLLEQDR